MTQVIVISLTIYASSKGPNDATFYSILVQELHPT